MNYIKGADGAQLKARGLTLFAKMIRTKDPNSLEASEQHEKGQLKVRPQIPISFYSPEGNEWNRIGPAVTQTHRKQKLQIVD